MVLIIIMIIIINIIILILASFIVVISISDFITLFLKIIIYTMNIINHCHGLARAKRRQHW